MCIRDRKDDNTTARTITWPSGFSWDDGTAPTLNQFAGGTLKNQIFKLITRDNGASWYAKEVVNMDFITPYSLWAWGEGDDGNLGQNVGGSGANRSSPVQIPGQWGQVNSRHMLSEGSAIFGLGGGIGDGSNTQRSSPTQVLGGIGYAELGGGGSVYRAVKNDGTLWAWGNNAHGGLGQNNQTYYSSPVQIPGTTWSKPSISMSTGGDAAAGCIKTDGTLWMWGRNFYRE